MMPEPATPRKESDDDEHLTGEGQARRNQENDPPA
jgi:hypothetical protein